MGFCEVITSQSGRRLVEFSWTLTTSIRTAPRRVSKLCFERRSDRIDTRLAAAAAANLWPAFAGRNISNNIDGRPTIDLDVRRFNPAAPGCTEYRRTTRSSAAHPTPPPPSLPCFMPITDKVIQGHDGLAGRHLMLLSDAQPIFASRPGARRTERRRSDAPS